MAEKMDSEREAFESWVRTTSGWKACKQRGKPMHLRQNADGSYNDFRVNDRWFAWKARAHLAQPAQATTCAGCGEHKATPLRIDAMGGYVCLTCIDQKLSALLGEFGYPEPQPTHAVDVDSLAQEIRRVDGTHSLGAGALAEALMPFITRAIGDKP